MSYVDILLDELEFGECIGYGSFGSVYKASWKSKEKVVAVKKVLRLDNEVCTKNIERCHLSIFFLIMSFVF